LKKITLETESYLIKGKDNERFYPFLELEYNEHVIYENDEPKYYFYTSEETQSESKIVSEIVEKIKNGKLQENIIKKLGDSIGKKWSLFSSHLGKEKSESFKLEKVDLIILNDKIFNLEKG